MCISVLSNHETDTLVSVVDAVATLEPVVVLLLESLKDARRLCLSFELRSVIVPWFVMAQVYFL